MALLKAADAKKVREHLESLTNPVRVVVFTDSRECAYCDETAGLVEEVASLSPQVAFERHDLATEPALAELYRVDRAPGIAIVQESAAGAPARDFGVRFSGIPSGYEFTTFIEALILVSNGQAPLSRELAEWVGSLEKPVRLQVFVTPTCPYCPQMVHLAHKLAVASDLVSAEGVEATEFPELANRYSVYGVPRTVIEVAGGGEVHVEGAVPETRLLAELRKAVGASGG